MSINSSGDVKVRLAEESEHDAVFRLRHEIYVEELGLQHLATAGDHSIRDEEDASGRLLVAVAGEEIVGSMRLNLGADAPIHASFRRDLQLDQFLAVVPEERILICSRFVVSPEYRRSLVPFQLFARGAEEIADAGLELVFCDCQPHLIRLYYALGFRSYGRVFSPEGGDILVPLVLIGRDVEHLRSVGSPLLQLDIDFPEPSRSTRGAIGLLPREPVVHPAESAELERRVAEEGEPRLLRDLRPDEVRSVLAHSYILELEHGTRLISCGQVTRTVYLVLEGELEARDGERVVRTMSAGDTIGEVAFLLHSQRTLDVLVRSERAAVLGLHEPTLRLMIDSDARAAARLLWNLCETLARRLAAPGGS